MFFLVILTRWFESTWTWSPSFPGSRSLGRRGSTSFRALFAWHSAPDCPVPFWGSSAFLRPSVFTWSMIRLCSDGSCLQTIASTVACTWVWRCASALPFWSTALWVCSATLIGFWFDGCTQSHPFPFFFTLRRTRTFASWRWTLPGIVTFSFAIS